MTASARGTRAVGVVNDDDDVIAKDPEQRQWQAAAVPLPWFPKSASPLLYHLYPFCLIKVVQAAKQMTTLVARGGEMRAVQGAHVVRPRPSWKAQMTKAKGHRSKSRTKGLPGTHKLKCLFPASLG